METNKCDKCGSKITDSTCDCGIWLKPDDQPPYLQIFEMAIVAYNRMNIDYPISGDHLPTGTCIILFKGDYELCKKVKSYIKKEKNNGKQ